MESSIPRLRPVTARDALFLFRLFVSTRVREPAPVPAPHEQEALFRQQFDEQASWWSQEYPDASFDIVEVGGLAAGRLYVHRARQDHRIVDIALQPTHRGRGIGTTLLQAVMLEADRAGKLVSLHVSVFNPARRLYERLGFVQVEDRGAYLLMVRTVVAVSSHRCHGPMVRGERS